MFLWMYFIMSYDDLRDLAKGGNQPNLNCEIIKNYRVICPPISLQNEFVDFFKQVDKSKYYRFKFISLCRKIVNIEEEMLCQTLSF